MILKFNIQSYLRSTIKYNKDIHRIIMLNLTHFSLCIDSKYRMLKEITLKKVFIT